MWDGREVYVVGGGPSLKPFDWDLIRGKNTIGCNSAFILGADIIKINLFADFLWWKSIGEVDGAVYGGMMVGCCPRLEKEKNPPWLLTLPRKDFSGLAHDALGFNGNTGAMAINLALILGAKRVYLLGFDMKAPDPANPNWHNVRYEKGNADVYKRFILNFKFVWNELPTKFPGREVINVTDDSDLPYFPRLSTIEHFGRNPFTRGT